MAYLDNLDELKAILKQDETEARKLQSWDAQAAFDDLAPSIECLCYSVIEQRDRAEELCEAARHRVVFKNGRHMEVGEEGAAEKRLSLNKARMYAAGDVAKTVQKHMHVAAELAAQTFGEPPTDSQASAIREAQEKAEAGFNPNNLAKEYLPRMGKNVAAVRRLSRCLIGAGADVALFPMIPNVSAQRIRDMSNAMFDAAINVSKRDPDSGESAPDAHWPLMVANVIEAAKFGGLGPSVGDMEGAARGARSSDSAGYCDVSSGRVSWAGGVPILDGKYVISPEMAEKLG